MERLTDRTVDGIAYVKSETGVEGVGASTTQRRLPELITRLAAYEDTGLEPKQVLKIVNVFRQFGEEYNCWFDFVVGFVCKYAQAEQDGRLVVLPCKVGDTVFAAETSPVIPLSVVDVGMYLEGTDGEDWEALNNFGKTVFLTREEAKTALAEKGADNV